MRVLTALTALALATPAFAQDFPVTLRTERGPITLDEVPERIVVVCVHEQDFLYALGIAPVGGRGCRGGKPFANWPWADAARQESRARPEILMGWEINAEWVASLDSDLIVAIYFRDLTAEDHALLSQIAPVLTAPPGHPRWGTPWREEPGLLAAGTGTVGRAEEIIADLEAHLAAVRAAHPDLEGRTAAAGYDYGGNVGTYTSADTAHGFLRDLGLVIPPEHDDLANDRRELDFSLENLSLIDLDLFIVPDEPLEGGELAQLSPFQALDLAREARAIDLVGNDLAAATSVQTPLALAWLYEVLPSVMPAAEGDPATRIPRPAVAM